MLKEKIYKDLVSAMKNKEELKLSTLRMIKAEIMKYEVSGANKVADDEIVLDIIKKGVKQRKDSANAFEKGGKIDFAKKELAEIEIIKNYMPEEISEDVLRKIVKETIESMNAQASDFGKVMGASMAKCKATKATVDGNDVSRIVKELLS